MLDLYIDNLASFADVKREAFLRHYYAYVYVRILQALGAYGFRGFYERKAHFLQSVPYALKNLRWLLHNVKLPIALPTLMEAFNSMLASEKLHALASEAESLTVRIMSFSFHRGMPKDESGHGGGFVFDGRSLPNPGREERFKTLTGKDAPVMDYLNQQESVHQYMASVMSLVDASVSEYQRRGFKNLMVSFGCTGGQHRSVYLAEQLAKRLRGRNGVEVVIQHRELEAASERFNLSRAFAVAWKSSVHITELSARFHRGAMTTPTRDADRWGRRDEGNDSGRRPGHAFATVDERSSQGAGGSCRAHDARDHVDPLAGVWNSRGDCECASLSGDR